jgi:CDP-paratose 2-epimerase
MAGNTLVTGGAGFVGSNLTDNLLRDGHSVTILDALSRRGSERNLAWLRSQHGGAQLRFIQDDVRRFDAVRAAAEDADVIYHLAGQVAVTSSVEDPQTDFEINAGGTLNVLEAARLSGRRPVVVFTSTNKVYGGMDDVDIVETPTGYGYRDYPDGIPESRSLDFHSPYGCSKGAADQYVHDYARIYDLPTVVLRMSCIYGPRQFGNEDQGWVAHFLISAVTGQPITIYGDGRQVRDVLFVDDLVRALRLAVEKIYVTAGQIYNIGGGPNNALSVWTEFGALLADLMGRRISVRFADWRPGDQLCYISDIRRANEHMGWQPQIDKETGIRRLWQWVTSNVDLFLPNTVSPDASLQGAGSGGAP